MRSTINNYLNYYSTAWSPTTLKSEASRLRSVEFFNKPPDQLYDECVKLGMKPYSIKTLFVRISHFENWAKKHQQNYTLMGYASFVKRHANKFKYVYKREDVALTYDEAADKIKLIKNPEAKRLAGVLLRTGLRISELWSVDGKDVVGKGGKSRPIFESFEKPKISKETLYRELKKVNLKPHTLRKLLATKVARNGARPEDLCRIFGWSNIQTAFIYLQPSQDNQLKTLLQEANSV